MNIRRSLALLFAGALASTIGRLFIQPPFPYLYLCILILVLIGLILYGAGAISMAAQQYYYPWRRKGNTFLAAKVGILNDIGDNIEDKEVYSWADIIPGGWKKETEKLAGENKMNIKTKLIDVSKEWDSYIAILNPYGGVYPEHDVKTFKTLNKIFDYVNKGGVFVNVADIPGYWSYNLLLKRRLDATPPIYGVDRTPNGQISIIPIRPFDLTPFMEKLGLRVFNIENATISKWKVEFEDRYNMLLEGVDEIRVDRATVVERNVRPVIKPKRDGGTNLTPLFLAGYGNGEFLISQVFINKDHPQNSKMKEIVVKIMIEVIKEKCRENR